MESVSYGEVDGNGEGNEENFVTPYYQDNLITIYHGDAREVLPQLEPVDVIYTDPIWPNCEKVFPGVDATRLFAETAKHFKTKKLLIQLGIDSDPRFLQGVPADMKFVRLSMMEYVPPRHKGSILSADIVYFFGEKILPEGKRCFPGVRILQVSQGGGAKKTDHPAPRGMQHANWVIVNYTRQTDIILDPFSGSGTFLISAARNGRKSIGIEIEEKWCADTVRRIKSEIGLLSDMEGSKCHS